MQFKSQNLISEKHILWLIILIGSVLRTYHAFEIPFTHDELSAITRLQYNSFSDLIEYGVKVDGHPALIQVFLYYWTQLFGLSEFVVKLPFILMGITSIPLSYVLTKKWFNSTSALLVAAFIASLQFPIMFSQIARPYISGMFLILLLSYFWTDFLFNSKYSKWSLLGIIIFASLNTYNHYFSFMLAGIIGLTGFFFLTKNTFKAYLIAFILVGILFIPHLNTFLYQLSLQGLDWLSAPTSSFLIEHIKFIFHFSYFVYLLAFSLVVFGLFQSKKVITNKFQWVSLTWFLLPIIVGVTYSISVKPVVQYSVLIFSFPFLLIFLFSWIKPIKSEFQALIVLLILAINSFSLIYEREHYTVYYHQPIQEFSILTHNFIQGDFTERVPENFEVFYGDEPKFLNFYFTEQNPNISYNSQHQKEVDVSDFKSVISKSNFNYLVLGNIDPSLVLVAREYFPYLIHTENGLNYSYYILGKSVNNKSVETENILFDNTLNFEKENPIWPNYRRELDWDNFVLKLDSTQEWGPNLSLNLDEITQSRHTLVEVKLDFKTDQQPKGLIVVSVTKNDKQLSWNAINLNKYYSSNQINQWQTAYFSTDLTSAFQNSSQLKGSVLSINYWNKDLLPITIDNFEVKIKTGNPYLYGTIQPID